MKIATRCWKDLSKMQVLNAMEPECAKRLVSVGADEPMAESLAEAHSMPHRQPSAAERAGRGPE